MSSYLAYGSIGVKVRAKGQWCSHISHPVAGIDSTKSLNTNDVIKRAMDILFSGCSLIALSPLFLILAVLIRLQSYGPVLYRSLRAGKNGRPFTCYKFRTMVEGADQKQASLRCKNERVGATFKMVNDPRVTSVGRFLRRYSLDELPQLWNVLRGDMSLVGPRPHPLQDVQRYEPSDFQRLEITPGLTGLWQVTARRDPSFRRNIALDLEYIERRNFWMDLSILYRTVFAIIEGTGA
jgi:lipopolysaccharide/colanic/teichoic acid biosynthesis glycosyltransferase